MARSQSSEDSEVRSVSRILVKNLLLDAQNPRLAPAKSGDSQEDLLKILWTEMAVDEVALSIAANGFFEEEPLFAIPANAQETDQTKRRFVVVEGNRRLAALCGFGTLGLGRESAQQTCPKFPPKTTLGLSDFPYRSTVPGDHRAFWRTGPSRDHREYRVGR